MSTLTRRFPRVKTIMSLSTKQLPAIVEPYLSWHLITADDHLSLLLCKYPDKCNPTHSDDMVILVGDVAQEWLKQRRKQTAAAGSS
jgi:hypothetical protein